MSFDSDRTMGVYRPPGVAAEVVARRRRIPVIHIVLFAVTFATVALNGAFISGENPLEDPWSVRAGFPFAIALMSILLIHELGHYTLARWHNVSATLPYFIPAPPIFVGTFGAFIRMRSLPPGRPALFDVGAAGPWAGFVAAIAAMVVGLQLSEVRAIPMTTSTLWLGDSLLTSGLVYLTFGSLPDGMTVYFHPIAFAGWVGLFVTVLNLLPMGQLDGGHIAYAMFGRRHRYIARLTFIAMAVLGSLQWSGWYAWVIFPLIIGLDHPPTVEDWVPVRGWRRVGGWLTVAMFVAIFMPNPIEMRDPPAELEGERIEVHAMGTQWA
jgi:membrane-associated protease RseP (regulator of RpoE activity)